MQKEPRNHHWISQFYLRGFSEVNKNSLFCYDKIEQRNYYTNIKNIYCERDFNRMDLPNPNALESSLSDFETIVANSIRSIDKDKKFSGDDKINLLNLIALFTIRNPTQRIFFQKVANQINKAALSLTVNLGVIKPNFDESLNSLNAREFFAIENILPSLLQRTWTLLIAPDNLFYITSNNPVILCWKENIKGQFLPGFYNDETYLIFPINKKIALIGDFNGEDQLIQADLIHIAAINTCHLNYAQKIYSTYPRFSFINDSEKISIFEIKSDRCV